MTAGQAAAIAGAYLSELKDIHATRANSPEVSYYPALAGLFNIVGKTLIRQRYFGSRFLGG